MTYKLIKVLEEDKEKIYMIKKNSIKSYIESIWGWDEKYQVNDFDESYIISNFRKIILDSKLIGFIEVISNNKRVNITEIHIVNEHQGKGIGTDIIKQIIDDSNTKGIMLTLGCFKRNLKALNLYERLGFKIQGKTETHYKLQYDKNDK